MEGRDETIYYIKQSYQEQVRDQATLFEHQHTSWTPLSMVNDFNNDIIINTYDIIYTDGMILHMISEMISCQVLY
jgi:hypothetical protein